ncbi:alpha-methylacyl-CoA racemase [Microdochium nivale]|nr:alpha-methylacyl-CoA racemase [Microdochium nivale]
MAIFLKGDYIFSHFYDVAIATTKLAVLALYYRIFATPAFRRVVICTAAVVAVWLAGMEVTLGLGCRPIEAWWGAVGGTCVDKVAFTYATNIINILLDVWIFIMPIPIICGLRTGQHKKVSLVFLFSIGLGTCAISAARLKYVFSTGTRDFTWEMTGLGILSAWEPCGGILCANLPVVYRYLVQMANRVRASLVSASHPSESKTHISAPRSQARMQHDWERLPVESMGLSTVVLHNYYRREDDVRVRSLELERLPWEGIKVEQSIHQQREW